MQTNAANEECEIPTTFVLTERQPRNRALHSDVLLAALLIYWSAPRRELNNVYYWSPDNVEWQDLGLGFTEFVGAFLTSKIGRFNEHLRWSTWRKDTMALAGDQCYAFYPFLWTKEGSVEGSHRAAVSVAEAFDTEADIVRQLGKAANSPAWTEARDSSVDVNLECYTRARSRHRSKAWVWSKTSSTSGDQMKRLFAPLLLIVLVSVSIPAVAQTADDETQIRAIATSWEKAWNRHDMKALARLLTEDADFVNVAGRHWKGRNQIEAQHTERLGQFKDSTWTTKAVTVQFVRPDIALVHVDWGIAGDTDPDGTARKPREGVFTWLLVKNGGQWQIRAVQNTNINNPPIVSK